jgi:hypothetical protein
MFTSRVAQTKGLPQVLEPSSPNKKFKKPKQQPLFMHGPSQTDRIESLGACHRPKFTRLLCSSTSSSIDAALHITRRSSPPSTTRSLAPPPHIETMYASRLRAAHSLSRQCALARRSFTSTARQLDLGSAVPTTAKEATPPQVAGEEPLAAPIKQAPNREGVWSRSQKPRPEAMTGPRFEQTDYSMQVCSLPRSYLNSSSHRSGMEGW